MNKVLHSRLRDQAIQIGNTIDSYMNTMDNNLLELAFDPNVMDLMEGNYSDEARKFTLYKNVYGVLRHLKNLNQWNQFYLFCYSNKGIFSSDMHNITDDYTDYHLENYPWFVEINKSNTNLVLLNNFSLPANQRGDYFAVALRYQSLYTLEIKGLVIMSADKRFFDDLIKNTSFTSIDFILVTDRSGEIVYSSKKWKPADNEIGKDEIQTILKENNKNYIDKHGRKFIVNTSFSQKSGWNVLCFSDETVIEKNLNYMNFTIILLTSLCIGLLLVLSLLISSRFTKPVIWLTKLMRNAEKEKYRIVSDIERNDEIGDLSREFNAMIRNVLENQILRRESEMDALQQQINPHFLYNTLNSVRALAISAGNMKIRSIIEQLSDMFRYSMNRESKKNVNIKDEIQHVQNYILIQKIRYEDRLKVIFEIDEGIYGYQTLKFILQPIVENAICHGIEMKERDGLIIVRGYFSGENIILEVFDNGNGMNNEELLELNTYISSGIHSSLLRKTSGIGLSNIQERLQLFFGEEYGLTIHSEKGQGTTVRIKIPAWRENGDKNDV